MTHGKWDITSMYINDTKVYAVYRLRDVNGVDHSGNREFASGYMTSRTEAETIAERLNREQQD